MNRFVIACILLLLNTTLYAEAADKKIFEKLFADWTQAFNRKDLNASCGLFAPNVTAAYQGFETRTYQTICDDFKKTFANSKETSQYRFDLHDVYRAGDLAAVRITWYLTVEANGKPTKSQDEVIDILKLNEKGEWKVINYLAYPVSTSPAVSYSS